VSLSPVYAERETYKLTSKWVSSFVQVKSLNRIRDIRDQLAGLCERVEIVPESNEDSTDISPIQKSIVAGFFFNAVCRLSLC
jgi:hypothetical protein